MKRNRKMSSGKQGKLKELSTVLIAEQKNAKQCGGSIALGTASNTFKTISTTNFHWNDHWN